MPKKNNLWVTLALVAAIVGIFVFSFALAPKPTGDGEEGFAGTDSVVTQVLEEEGTEPWFQPIFEPGSGEIESGLFALQAALGAGIVGFALGNLRGRAKSKEELAAAGAASDSSAASAPDTPVPAVE
ncbi:energy-coupling factor ABC transporter substrate-binding protein [Brooklawnia sp.]|uniref:energy-coupling factor ABC transporter substrate-binding protein n=1 Tax=Brooklawnia sp. TaxID=2699740 RepID=UPI00311D5CB2